MIYRIKNAWNCLMGNPPTIIKEKIKVLPYSVTRHQIGSIDKNEVRYLEKMSHQDLDEHKSDISGIYMEPAFKRELNCMLDTQVYWLGQEADGDRQQTFGKGTINGISLVLERFELINSEIRKMREPKAPLTDEDKHDKFISEND